MSEYRINARAHLELAEAAWGGSLRTFAEFLRGQARLIEGIAGQDEHSCTICGAKNFDESGLLRVGECWLGFDGQHYCEDHFTAGMARFHRKYGLRDSPVDNG